MKLHFSPTSPFVRKVMVCAHERGLAARIEPITGADVAATNPLSKVPALITDEGTPLFDSLVICDYLDTLDGKPTLIPTQPDRRTAVLCRHALADGILEAGVATMGERRRPEDKRWSEFFASQRGKITRAIDRLEAQAEELGDTIDLGTITVGVALGYVDFRLGDLGWRETHPRLARWYETFAQRPSMQQTAPPG